MRYVVTGQSCRQQRRTYKSLRVARRIAQARAKRTGQEIWVTEATKIYDRVRRRRQCGLALYRCTPTSCVKLSDVRGKLG